MIPCAPDLRDPVRPQRRRHILVPLGLAPLGETKLPVARDCALAFGADVLLLHISSPKARSSAEAQSGEAAARAYIDAAVAHMHAAGVAAEGLVRCGPIAATIVREARERDADMIIIGAPLRSGFLRAVLGSVADAVVKAAPCPVLLVQPAVEAGVGPALRSFTHAAALAGALHRRPSRQQTVEVSRIVGSVGRIHELAANFRPPRGRRRSEDEDRLAGIRSAMERGEPLPAVELYQLGFGFYVLDGHHRVAAARLLGQLALDANVVEFLPALGARRTHDAAPERSEQPSGASGLTARLSTHTCWRPTLGHSWASRGRGSHPPALLHSSPPGRPCQKPTRVDHPGR
jgi:nucleotide-binding universal stress UspA family protein